jgi:hypothetical protein
MFARKRGYYYDQDPLREPLVKPYATPGRQKPGLMRRDAARDLRVISNPMGRNSGSVWRINNGNYKGKHTATFPPELVRRMIASTCDDNSLVLDPFGGAGTTAMTALQMGHRASGDDGGARYLNRRSRGAVSGTYLRRRSAHYVMSSNGLCRWLVFPQPHQGEREHVVVLRGIKRFREGDSIAIVPYLLPRIDFLPRLPIAGAEVPIVEYDRAKAGVGERLCEPIQVHLLHRREAVRHYDSRHLAAPIVR